MSPSLYRHCTRSGLQALRTVQLGPKMSLHPPALYPTLCPQLGFCSPGEWLDLLFIPVLQSGQPREALLSVSAGWLKGCLLSIKERIEVAP